MKVLACQICIPTTNTHEQKVDHIARVGQLIEQQVAQVGNIDLVVLPELSTISYGLDAFSALNKLAEELQEYSHSYFNALAKKLRCHIAYGFPRKHGKSYHISHAIVGPTISENVYYDKIHLADIGDSSESGFFSPGNHLCVFDIAGFRIGVVICYDFRFQALTTMLAQQHGVEFIIHPVAFTKDATFHSWHSFAICRAIENQVYFLSLNRAGQQWGNSIFCPPWLDEQSPVVRFGEQEECSVIELRKDTLQAVRETYPITRNRLPDYQVLLKQ